MTNPGAADEIRAEHFALLYALSVLADDTRFQTEIYRGLAGRGPVAWHVVLMRAAAIIADTIPRYGPKDFREDTSDRDAVPPGFTRAEAAEEVQSQLTALVGRHGGVVGVNDVDGDLSHMDEHLRRLLDGDTA